MVFLLTSSFFQINHHHPYHIPLFEPNTNRIMLFVGLPRFVNICELIIALTWLSTTYLVYDIRCREVCRGNVLNTKIN